MPDRTLQIKRPIGHTLSISLVMLLLMFAGLEAVLRVEFLQPRLIQLVPSLGSRHHQLELQLARLDYLVAREGPVDCIFLGSSLVWLGYDPDIFEEVVQQETGQKINCFNLGIEALPASAAGVLAPIIVAKYHPQLLIYGTSARDFAPGMADEETQVILDTPWVQQQAGNWTLRGWLYTNSYVFRYAVQINNFLKLDPASWREMAYSPQDLNGFLPKTRPPQEIHFQVAAKVAAQWFQPYQIKPENIQGLQQVIAQRNDSVQVIVVEMPVQQSYYDYFENGKEDYDRFADEVSHVLAAEGTPFLQTSPLSLIPDEGWWDRSHMNWTGANIFSEWLGHQIVQMMAADNLRFSEAPTANR